MRTPTLHLSSPAQHSRTEHTKLRVIRALALRARRGRGECAQLEVARDGWSWTMCYKHPRKVHCAASQRAAYPNILVAADTAGREVYHSPNDADISRFSINLIVYWILFKHHTSPVPGLRSDPS